MNVECPCLEGEGLEAGLEIYRFNFSQQEATQLTIAGNMILTPGGAIEVFLRLVHLVAPLRVPLRLHNLLAPPGVSREVWSLIILVETVLCEISQTFLKLEAGQRCHLIAIVWVAE